MYKEISVLQTHLSISICPDCYHTQLKPDNLKVKCKKCGFLYATGVNLYGN